MPADSLLDSTLDDDVRAVVVAAYNSPIEAEMAKGRLEVEGINSDLLDVHTASIGTHLTLAIGGVKVRVREDDAERAHEVLNQLGDFTLPDGDEDEPEEEALARTDEPLEPDALVARALASAMIGVVFFPPLNLYSLWLIVRALQGDERLTRNTLLKMWGALAFDALALSWLALFFGWL
jgi:hypothetical protein